MSRLVIGNNGQNTLVKPSVKQGTEISFLDRTWVKMTKLFWTHWTYLKTPFQSSNSNVPCFVVTGLIFHLVHWYFLKTASTWREFVFKGWKRLHVKLWSSCQAGLSWPTDDGRIHKLGFVFFSLGLSVLRISFLCHPISTLPRELLCAPGVHILKDGVLFGTSCSGFPFLVVPESWQERWSNNEGRSNGIQRSHSICLDFSEHKSRWKLIPSSGYY